MIHDGQGTGAGADTSSDAGVDRQLRSGRGRYGRPGGDTAVGGCRPGRGDGPCDSASLVLGDGCPPVDSPSVNQTSEPVEDPTAVGGSADVDAGADGAVRDALPDDLDVRGAGLVGPYVFPDNGRRRIPGGLYLLFAAITVVVVVMNDGSSLVDGGLVGGSIGLALVGLYHLQAGWSLEVDEADALVAAVRAVGFPVGHASAQMAWRGLRSRPTWRVLVYSNESPPEHRGLVFVDGVDGEVVATHVEDNPEDWS